MHTVKRSIVVPYNPSDMYNMVADIDRYHEFLPWCTRSRVLETKGDEVLGELHVGYGKVSTTFRTRNRNLPAERIEMRLDSGPFHTLEGSWTFEPSGEGCRSSTGTGRQTPESGGRSR
jgi:ribosome-associated toxin RatA of RatAB toxin-antitoxin module